MWNSRPVAQATRCTQSKRSVGGQLAARGGRGGGRIYTGSEEERRKDAARNQSHRRTM